MGKYHFLLDIAVFFRAHPTDGVVALAIGTLAIGARLLWQASTEWQSSLQSLAPTDAAADESRKPAAGDIVHCSLFAPRQVAPSAKFKVQSYLHLIEDWRKVEPEAVEIDPTASRRRFEALERPIVRGALVDLFLFSDDLIVAQPERQLRWEGRPAKQVFEVEARADLTSNLIEAVLRVLVDGITVGRIEFKVHVEAKVPSSDETTKSSTRAERYAETRAINYEKAFISYARVDFEMVSGYAQALELVGVELLMDVTSLEPGQEWEKQLSALIARADVVYLMWTDSAAKSKWVDRETRQAVELYNCSDPHRPGIIPIPRYTTFPALPDHLKKFQADLKWAEKRSAYREPLVDETPRT
jgi:hypothetical protein